MPSLTLIEILPSATENWTSCSFSLKRCCQQSFREAKLHYDAIGLENLKKLAGAASTAQLALWY